MPSTASRTWPPVSSHAEKAARGKLPTDVWWHTIVPTTGREKTGYPTQKPEGVLRRIVQASSRPGDRVLDLFAGSGTTGAVAAALGRNAVLVDANPEAIEVMVKRMPDAAVVVSARRGRGSPPESRHCSRSSAVSSRLMSAARANSSFAKAICSSLSVAR